MNEERYSGYDDDIEISLVDMIFYLIGKWRTLILALVLGALLGGGIYMVKARAASSAAADEEEDLEELSEGFDEDDYEIDDEVLENMAVSARYRVKYRELREYLEDSLIMQIDPNGFYRGTYEICISGCDDITAVAAFYSSVLSEDGILDELAEVSGLDCEGKYLYELMSVSVTYAGAADEVILSSDTFSSAVITFTVDTPYEEATEAILTALADHANDAAAEAVSVCGSFDTDELTYSVQLISDDYYLTQQNTYTSLLDTYHTKYTGYEDDFTDEELEFYTFKYLMPEDEAEQSSEEAAEAPALLEEEEEGGSSAAKWLIIGIFLGIVIWGVIYVLAYLLDGRVRSGAEVSSSFRLPLIGRLEGEDEKRGIDGFINHVHGNFKERPDSVGYIADALMKLGCGSAVICGDMESPIVRENADAIASLTEGFDVSDWSSRSAEALEKAKAAGHEVIIVCAKKTRRKDVRRELECCRLQGIKVIGVICVEG